MAEQVQGNLGGSQYQSIPINPPSNSHKSKAKKDIPEKNVQQVTRSVGRQRKKPLGKQVVESFSGEDAKTTGGYLLFDVLIPSAKELVVDLIQQGAQRLILGEGGRLRSASRPSYNVSRPGYTVYTAATRARDDRPGRGPRRQISSRARENHNFGEIILETRGEAEEALDELGALVDQYDAATVSDLYKLVGITGSFTDDRWGWTNLANARVRMIMGGGYVLDLPNPIYLD